MNQNNPYHHASQTALSFFESLSSKGQSVMSDLSWQYPLYRFWDHECRSSRPPAVPSLSLCCWDAQSSHLFLMEIAPLAAVPKPVRLVLWQVETHLRGGICRYPICMYQNGDTSNQPTSWVLLRVLRGIQEGCIFRPSWYYIKTFRSLFFLDIPSIW